MSARKQGLQYQPHPGQPVHDQPIAPQGSGAGTALKVVLIMMAAVVRPVGQRAGLVVSLQLT